MDAQKQTFLTSERGGYLTSAIAVCGMAETDHGRVIAIEAKDALIPLGFKRRGRSRLWVADRGWWLSVIEFQPSSFSKGTYCNVAVHWLWNPHDTFSFDSGLERAGSFASFTNVEMFTAEVRAMVSEAARLAASHQEALASLEAAASWAVRLEPSRQERGTGGDWPDFHAGIASGLAGDVLTATRMFERLLATNGALDWQISRAAAARDLLTALTDEEAFRAMVQARIDARRSSERLPPFVLPVRSA